MSSVIDICNLALGELGAGTITSLSEASSEAKACNRYYDISRKMLLRLYDWNFAKKISTLTLASGESAKPDWEYIYLYPSNCLKIIKVYSEDNNIYTYVDEETSYNGDYLYDLMLNDAGSSSLILTNVENARVSYVYNVTDPTMFRVDFEMCLSYLLASNMAQTLTGDVKLKSRAYGLFLEELKQSKNTDANERNITFIQQNPYIKARR